MHALVDLTTQGTNDTARTDSTMNNASGLIARNFHFTLTPNYFMAVIHSVTFIVGVAGNLLLIIINAWQKSSKQVATQLFITSLAVSDLGLLFAKTWISAFVSVDANFRFGRFMCKISNFWTQFAANASITSLSAVSVDR